ncbi:unnamed protein product [Malus baccata var. baccata]
MINLLTLCSMHCVLFPIVINFYIPWWFIHFVDRFFSPFHAQIGIDIFGMKYSEMLSLNPII